MQKSNLCSLKFLWNKALHRSQMTGIYGDLNWGYLLFPVIIYISVSCEKKSGQDGQVIGYTVDTLVIDSKGRLLDLNGWMLTSDLDDKETSFYLYNSFDLSIDEINLDRQEFVRSYPLEAEGPNGVGEYIFNLQLLNDSLFFTKSFIHSSLIDRNGHIVKRMGWEDARDSKGMKLEQFPRKKEVVTGKEDMKVFGVNFDLKNREVFLDVLSVRDNTVNRFDIDPENSYHDFFFRFDDEANFLDPAVHLGIDKNYIRISHQFSNEIILFNPEGEFVKVVHYEPQLTPKRAKVPEGSEIKSREQIKKDYQHILEQVRFETPVWDGVKNRYFRLSSKRIFTDTYKNERSLVPETKETIVFLSVLDGDFNQISEMEIDELNDDREKYFAKGGKLWVCQNFSDELGFLVFDLVSH